jgi:hypothetical protein
LQPKIRANAKAPFKFAFAFAIIFALALIVALAYPTIKISNLLKHATQTHTDKAAELLLK